MRVELSHRVICAALDALMTTSNSPCHRPLPRSHSVISGAKPIQPGVDISGRACNRNSH